MARVENLKLIRPLVLPIAFFRADHVGAIIQFQFLGCVARVENSRFRADHFRADHGGANYFDFGLCGQNRRGVIYLNPYYRLLYATKTKKKNNIKGLARGSITVYCEFGNQNGNIPQSRG